MEKTSWKKNTAIFLTGQAVSIFGSSLVQYAITWHITITTQSGVYMMLSILFGILPTFFLSPFAGVWADRYNRKLLIILADGGIALCTLVVAVLYMLGHGSIWLLFAALAFRALGTAVQTPSIGAMLPDMVPEQHLTRVNGINSSIQSLITLVSPMLSAGLMGVAPLEYIFFIDVGTAAIAIFVMLVFFRLPTVAKKASDTVKTYFEDLKLGFRYIADNKYLRSFFVFCILFFFLMAPVAFLTSLQVTRVYGGQEWRLAALEIAFSAGMLVGGILISIWGGFKNRVHTMILAAFIMAGCNFFLGLAIPFWLYLALMALFGFAMPLLNTAATVLLQEQVASEYLGRIFGVMTMLNTSIMPISMLLFGPLSDTIPIEWILLVTGVAIFLCVATLTQSKTLLRRALRRGTGTHRNTQEQE